MQTKRKILIVAESIDVDDSSGSKANVALILNLRDIGYEVIVLHYTRKKIFIEGIESVAIKEIRTGPLFLMSRIQRKIQHGLNINLAKYLEPIFGFSFTFFNDVTSITRAVQKKWKDFDLVLTLSKGASFRPHYAVLRLPGLHNKWMAYIHDPYPFHYYPSPFNWTEPGHQQKIRFFKRISEKCQWAAFPSLLLKEWMENFFPAFKKNSLVIPHQMRSEKDNSGIPIYFKEGEFILLHAGNLLKQRSPIPLIKGYQKFLNKYPQASDKSQLLLLGRAPDHQNEIELFKNQIKQLYFSGDYVPYREMQSMQKNASVNIILESTADESPFLPGKFPHCIASEKPILLLGPSVSESRRLLGDDYPYWSEADNVERISTLIEILYLQWQKQGKSKFERKDLEFYLSKGNLSKILDEILI